MMKLIQIPRALIAPTLIASAVAISTLLPQAKAHFETTGSYPAVVCPGALSGATIKISLPTSTLLTRTISGKNTTLHAGKSNVILGSSAATFITGNSGSEVAFESISGTSTADA